MTVTDEPGRAGNTLEVLFSPADFEALAGRNLSQTVCVVFDVLRATSSMVVALSNGAKGVIPVSGIPEALAIRKTRAEVLLAGERDGLKIGTDLTGSIAFDLGNSPREFTAETVRGKTVVMTTTNGTRALNACAGARELFAGCLLNLGATVEAVRETASAELLLVCSGTFEAAAFEDVLAAGAVCERVWDQYGSGASDGAMMARKLYELHKQDLHGGIASGRNGRRLLLRPELAGDVGFCARTDTIHAAVAMKEGLLKVRS
jgi:2-phosphosulfolactate phosphatase